eukprot:6561580-Prymnesium_polylepis.1
MLWVSGRPGDRRTDGSRMRLGVRYAEDAEHGDFVADMAGPAFPAQPACGCRWSRPALSACLA